MSRRGRGRSFRTGSSINFIPARPVAACAMGASHTYFTAHDHIDQDYDNG